MRIRIVLLAVGSLACATSGKLARSAREPNRPPLALGSNEAGVTAAALRAVLALLPADAAAACVTLTGPPPNYSYSPDAALLKSIRSKDRRVLAIAACPPTYQSMAVFVPSPDQPSPPERPAGYLDPHIVDVVARPIIGPDSTVVLIHASQGTLIHYYRCVAQRTRRWLARCRMTATWTAALPSNVSHQLTGDGIKEEVVDTAVVRTVSRQHLPRHYVARS